MMELCPWCDLEYEITPETEAAHLAVCSVFQTLPVAFTREDGKTFVALPSNPEILCERRRVN